jgi:inner membrane protein
MDSVSQLVLGAAVGVAVMGRRTAVWKAAAWGAVCGTLPDLDAVIDYGDPIRNMTLHRAESHAFFYLTLVSPLLAWLIARIHGEMDRFQRWWLATWLALVTHPLLDLMTVYGTQVARPFSGRPFGVGSIFIIDPLYTLPLAVGVAAALLARDRARAARRSVAGLVLSTAYLAWGFGVQQHVAAIAAGSLRTQSIEAKRVLVTPAPFNTLLWRVVAITPNEFHEGYYSLLDRERAITFDSFSRGTPLYEEMRGDPSVERIASFSRGFFKMSQDGPRVLITDLRMGQEPYYTFNFVVGERHSRALPIYPPIQVSNRIDFQRGMPWLWRRLSGMPLPPPR